MNTTESEVALLRPPKFAHALYVNQCDTNFIVVSYMRFTIDI